MKKIKKIKKIYILLYIIYFITAIMLIKGSLSGKILMALFMPIFLIFDLSYFLIPLSVLTLIFISIHQFIIKDYTKYNAAFQISIVTLILGILSGAYEYLMSNKNILNYNYLTILVYATAFFIITMLTIRISKMGNTKYYLYIAIPLIMLLAYLIYGFGG